ncbi:NUDIX hydrolase [Rhizobium sp. KVB221]|uniref:NUDIX hydrolase n=1 Tax=Rhizobium setariae TaxID=2801340 RepID=A0A937CND2_9HYPH|nr:NUDIX hydrolase [Rhizobium setariae]MBL0370552.1 NUDIX hydrolase [Rhizobium setariae]
MNIFTGISDSVQLMFRRPRRGQFAALCYRIAEATGEPEILVLTSRDTGRWVIPKGWPMGDKPGHEVAAQEALEEAGVIGQPENQPTGTYTYQKGLGDGVAVPCQVQVYALRVTSQVENFKEKGKRRIEWVSPAVAERRVHEPELKRLIHHFSQRFSATRG